MFRSMDENVCQMPEDNTEPDVFVSYPESLGRSSIPLIVDNGSYMCRAGWANQKEPNLLFRNVIARNRGKRDLETQVGNDIKNADTLGWLLKSQFDRNVVTQFDIQEIIFDYVFSHLSINTDGSVNHPIVMSEALCNPNYSRQMMSELLFECYQVPSVLYGVDALFSWHHFSSSNKRRSGLIVSLGHSSSHVIPILDGVMDSQGCQRISVGGFQMASYLYRLLQLKYPSHYASVSHIKAEKLLHLYSYYSKDYIDEIKQWVSPDYYIQNVYKIQLPYSQSSRAHGSKLMCGKIEQCQALIERLKDSQLKRRIQKIASNEERLQQMNTVLEIYEESDFDLFQRALTEFGFQTLDDLRLGIQKYSQHVQKARFTLGTGDHRFMRELWELAQFPDPDAWIAHVRKRWEKFRDANLLKLNSGKQYDYERRSQENEDVDILDDDDDGQDDLDEFEEQERLRDYEECLREYENEFNKGEDHEREATVGLAEFYQLQIGIERMRCPEVLFQPSLIGLDQAGLAEVIQNTLSRYSPDQQNNIVQNVYLTGGCAKLPGLKDRIHTEMLQMRPFQSTFQITLAGDPALESWYGARVWGSHVDNIKRFAVSRAEYEEKGGDYLKEHSASNRFFPTVSRRSTAAFE